MSPNNLIYYIKLFIRIVQVKYFITKQETIILLSYIKNIFSTIFKTSKKKTEKSAYSISKEINSMSAKTYSNISQAIEATKGDEYYIYERREEKFICRGRWKDYKRQETNL